MLIIISVDNERVCQLNTVSCDTSQIFFIGLMSVVANPFVK